MNKVTDDGEIIDYGWYKEIHTDGPIKYDTPEYALKRLMRRSMCMDYSC